MPLGEGQRHGDRVLSPVTPPAGWLSDEALAAEVIRANPDASAAKLGVLIIASLRANHRLLFPPACPSPSERP